MKLSTKSRYGLNALYHLALTNETMSLKELSNVTLVTQPYLEKVLGMLRRGGFVKTSRGTTGGYVIAKDPKEITIGEVLRVLEKDLVFSDCAKSGKCSNTACPNKNIFKVIYDNLNDVLDSITLHDMINNKGENYE